MSFETYTESDLIKWFSKREVEKGRAYLNAVSLLDVKPSEVLASVQGTARYPYQVEIYFDDISNEIEADCSCPVGYFCKHTSATLLKLLEEREKDKKIRESGGISDQLLTWIEALHQKTAASNKPAHVPKEQIFYVLSENAPAEISFLKGSLNKDGQLSGSTSAWSNIESALVRPPKFISIDDYRILGLIWRQYRDMSINKGEGYSSFRYSLLGEHMDELLGRMLETGRLIAKSHHVPSTPCFFKQGKPRAMQFSWKEQAGKLSPQLTVLPSGRVLIHNTSTWYVDFEAGEIGDAKTNLPSPQLKLLNTLPPITPAEAKIVGAAMLDLMPDLPLPVKDKKTIQSIRTITVSPRPRLILNTSKVSKVSFREYPFQYYGVSLFDSAEAAFVYDDTVISPEDSREFFNLPSGEVLRVKRNKNEENQYLNKLEKYNFRKIKPYEIKFSNDAAPHKIRYGLSKESDWSAFMVHSVSQLRSAGWEVIYDNTFRHNVLQVDAWEADILETESGWFDLNMGIIVEGQRLSLAPLLANLFARDVRWLDAKKLAKIANNEPILLMTFDDKRISVPAERLKPLATTLIDLFDGEVGDSLRISKFDAHRLEAMADQSRWQFNGMDAVIQMAKRLKTTKGLKPVKPPKDLALTLRPYQLEGLSWLQHLRKHEISGMLADDMGLGKTAQTLAHLLCEKQAKRLDKPVLIVLPKSLIFNWKNEVARFAPTLSVLTLHGGARKELFKKIPKYHIVLTTYSLLWRDFDELAKHSYYMLILDEAQTVKNTQSRSSSVVRKLEAQHRLCITGTPLENHLGELWAQFDFLLPGFLGSNKAFTKIWRTPIEKNGNTARAKLLSSRLKPFILRRRKEEVAKELPPKTTIIRTVELEGAQRDLYETVRSAMDEKIRLEIAGKGFKRSQIMILDALLKLRQVCCDPRLVKSTAAKKVKERAKLEQLMEMLPDMVEEGRRILVFSQFTSMLDLIQQELNKVKLPYIILTGQTRDRETPIKQFQNGEASIFLISLRAGGVGLNLTAADTVIHYDPWWNPAVENQATDRAHRLGQNKHVFVYKLIVAGSIEERISELQKKKGDLAAGILSEDKRVDVKFSEEDLKTLFAPLPD